MLAHESTRTPVETADRRGATALAAVDLAALRRGRLERLQQSMRDHDLPACLLYNPANIRYATDTAFMVVWTLSSFQRYCVVPAHGEPVMFEYSGAMQQSAAIVDDVRPAIAWEFMDSNPKERADQWADELASVLRELGLEKREIALDRIDGAGLSALERAGFRVMDAVPAVLRAREVKLPEELDLMRAGGEVGKQMLAALEAAIEPGVTEWDLFAAMHGALAESGGEATIARMVSSGPNTNPWMREATDRPLGPGDLVSVDTDAIGPGGYFIDISRTFVCAEAPTARQRELYGIAYEHLAAILDAIRPGTTFAEVARAVPPLADHFVAQRYPVMMHGAGVEDEGPCIGYADQVGGTDAEERIIEPGMVFCPESYVGEVGGPYGVKLEEQVIVTLTGLELIGSYPFHDQLLC